MKQLGAIFFWALWIVSLPAVGAWGDGLQIPDLNRPLLDEAGILTGEEEVAIERMLLTLERSGKAQMAVYIPASLQGYEIANFSIEVVEKWKLGKKGVDQGLLLVIAPKERKMRFEVGYGLEGDLTDAFSRRLLDQQLVPYFRAGRFADGILVSIETVAQKLGADLRAPVTKRISSESRGRGGLPDAWKVVVFILILVFWLIGSIFRPRRARAAYGRRGGIFWGGVGGLGGRRSGGWGGGFGGGGGGFGGGGASSSW